MKHFFLAILFVAQVSAASVTNRPPVRVDFVSNLPMPEYDQFLNQSVLSSFIRSIKSWHPARPGRAMLVIVQKQDGSLGASHMAWDENVPTNLCWLAISNCLPFPPWPTNQFKGQTPEERGFGLVFYFDGSEDGTNVPQTPWPPPTVKWNLPAESRRIASAKFEAIFRMDVPAEPAFYDFAKSLMDAVNRRMDELVHSGFGFHNYLPGKIDLKVTAAPGGTVKVDVESVTSSPDTSLLAQKAVLDPAPFAGWPAGLTNPCELTLHFNFLPQ